MDDKSGRLSRSCLIETIGETVLRWVRFELRIAHRSGRRGAFTDLPSFVAAPAREVVVSEADVNKSLWLTDAIVPYSPRYTASMLLPSGSSTNAA